MESPLPPIPTSTQEWAQETADTIAHVEDTPPTKPDLQQRSSEADQVFPGSFPPGEESDNSKLTTQSILDTAQQAFQSASDTAKQYLPPSVSAYLRKNSMTSL